MTQRSGRGIEVILIEVTELILYNPISSMSRLPEALSNFSRRDFLKVSTLTLISLMGGWGSWWAFQVPGREFEGKIPYPNPGWLETRNPHRPQFVESNEGHKEYLKFMGKNDPLLNGILKTAFQDFFSSAKEDNTHPLLGDAFTKHVEYARNGLIRHFSHLKTEEPSLENILHVASFTFAAVYSPYFSKRELKDDFGVEVKVEEEDDQIWWLVAAADKVPTVFPVDQKSCDRDGKDVLFRCSGVDRAVHFAEHLFLAHQYYYSLNNQLQEARRIPNAARIFAGLSRNPEEQARLLSFLGGNMWEFKETIGQDKTFDNSGRIIPTGYWDSLVTMDLRANALGANFAIFLSQPGLTYIDLHKRLDAGVDFLNWPDLNRRKWQGSDVPGNLEPIQPFRLKTILPLIPVAAVMEEVPLRVLPDGGIEWLGRVPLHHHPAIGTPVFIK